MGWTCLSARKEQRFRRRAICGKDAIDHWHRPWHHWSTTPGPYAVGTTSFAFDGTPDAAARKTSTDSGAYIYSGIAERNHSRERIRVEFFARQKGLTTPWVTDRGAAYAHVDNEYIGLAESWSIPVPGGSLYEIIFDYGGSSSGEAVAVLASAQTYDSDTIT